ncbi:hypothetical protein [Amycolatopsis sp. CA-230715]|uniref:hypothetical protein n=1 Tax=Amycolatopsis sp. CA-230715 TaxID=2745196 RepID=UPI001C01AD3C|nr:hypothetical protein [Amycolatopsis sp. CA-230715]QWF78734.1 hypothetical protein HUW46_02132 [Amycolatopsis sp. CA-230715]
MSTLDRRTRAEIGRSSNRRGKEAEQAVARWLREHGWPDAQRTVRTGWKVGDHQSRDRGDIDGTRGLCWQVKTSRDDFTDTRVLAVLAATADQAVASGADYGIAIERRAGKTDPGRWWAWMTAGDLYALAETARNPFVLAVPQPVLDVPVRLLLRDLVPLLHAAGYGAPATNPTTNEEGPAAP